MKAPPSDQSVFVKMALLSIRSCGAKCADHDGLIPMFEPLTLKKQLLQKVMVVSHIIIKLQIRELEVKPLTVP